MPSRSGQAAIDAPTQFATFGLAPPEALRAARHLLGAGLPPMLTGSKEGQHGASQRVAWNRGRGRMLSIANCAQHRADRG